MNDAVGPKSVDVIVVNFNTVALTEHAIEEVGRHLSVRQIYCVDNSSSEAGTRRRLKCLGRNDPRVRVRVNEHNIGFARAVNAALDECLASTSQPDFVLLLNPDAIIGPTSLDAMLDHMQAHPDCGASAPRIASPGKSVSVHSAGYEPTSRRVLCQALQVYRLSPRFGFLRGVNVPGTAKAPVIDVDWASGACLLIRTAALMQVGTLSNRWFMYAEDQELCARLIAGGWKVQLLPGATATHLLSAAAATSSSTSTMWVHAQRDLYRLRHSSSIYHLGFDVAMASGFLLRALAAALLGRRRATDCVRFLAYARAALVPIDLRIFQGRAASP